MEKKASLGHLLAFLTIVVWGTTYISTKVLLTGFQPVEILFYRFVMGLLLLELVYPHRMKGTTRRQELLFALAGLTGVTLYFLLENIALTFTLASNAGVIISIAPFFTALLSRYVFHGEEKFHVSFFVGFLVAMCGIALLSFHGEQLHLNPVGDVLAGLAALTWAFYSNLTRKISTFGYHTIQTTRRIFFYGLVFMVPALFFFGFRPGLARFTNPVYLFNILFLGLCASALGFVTWNFALKVLGTVKTSVYIYLSPIVTVVTSAIVLHEPINLVSVVGTLLALAGLILSEIKWSRKPSAQ
ncbi:MAG: DMT family transporter [Faecalibacterium sp.]|jgi:drug/metabolite transporter (DMT)-like permease|nr:DMT family transporter [Faecalibacterium sp.]